MHNWVRVSMGAVALLLLAAAAGPLAAIISTAPDAPKAAVTDGLQAQSATSTLPLDIEAIKADPASAGRALAEAAAADAATVGALLVSAANSDPRATADALNAAAREDAAAIGEALASGPAKDPDALAALGELLPVTPWLPEEAPREGPSRYSTGVWEKAGSQGAIDLILVKLTKPGRRSNVSVTALPLGVLSEFQERTAGAAERKLEDTTPTSAGTLRSKLPAPPAGHLVAALVRLTPSGFPTLDLVAGHVTFSVEKGWLDENGIHPWSINFSVYALEQRAWQLSAAKRVREDAERVYYSAVVPSFSTWAVLGSEAPPEPSFRVDDLTIAPAQVGEGEPVTVEARVTNLTSEPAAPVLAVYLDSVPDSAQRVLLGPNEARTVTFDVQPKEGVREVRLDRLTGKLTVGPASAAPAAATLPGDAEDQSGDGIGAGVVVGAVAAAVAVVAVAVTVGYLRRRVGRPG
jgi:hypothetical protein